MSVYSGIILAKAINVKYDNAHNTKTVGNTFEDRIAGPWKIVSSFLQLNEKWQSI